MSVWKNKETGETYDDGIAGTDAASAPREAAQWHWPLAGPALIEWRGPSPSQEGSAT